MGSNSSQEAIGKRIAELRQKNNLTQSELASKLCVSREMINYWEKGSRDIKTGNIVLLSEVLNTTCDYLLQGIEPNSIDIFRDLGLSQAAIDRIREIKEAEQREHAEGLCETLSHILENDNFWMIHATICDAIDQGEFLLPHIESLLDIGSKALKGDEMSAYDRILCSAAARGLAPMYKHEISEYVSQLFSEITHYRDRIEKFVKDMHTEDGENENP